MNIETYASKHPKTRTGTILLENIEILARLPGKSRILDVGCAEGNTILWLRSKFPDWFTFYGIDFSHIRVKKAVEKKIRGAFFCKGKAEELPFENESTNFVSASQIIEHLPDDRQLIQEIARVLVPGGRFQVDTVFKKKWARYFYRSPAGWAIDPTHQREYTDIDTILSLFPSSLKIKNVEIIKSYRRLNIIRFFSFLPDWVKIRIPGYFTIYVSGEKVETRGVS